MLFSSIHVTLLHCGDPMRNDGEVQSLDESPGCAGVCGAGPAVSSELLLLNVVGAVCHGCTVGWRLGDSERLNPAASNRRDCQCMVSSSRLPSLLQSTACSEQEPSITSVSADESSHRKSCSRSFSRWAQLSERVTSGQTCSAGMICCEETMHRRSRALKSLTQRIVNQYQSY